MLHNILEEIVWHKEKLPNFGKNFFG